MLGYVNFSTGKPDARFQKQVNDAFTSLHRPGACNLGRILVLFYRAASKSCGKPAARRFARSNRRNPS